MDGTKSLSSEQFREIAPPPKSHSADDNFSGRARAPEAPRPAYREPVEGGAAWQSSTLGVGRPTTPMSSGYMKPIVSQ